MAGMLRVVSISLGPSSRDKAVEIELLGRRLMIERIGADGQIDRFARFLRQYDGVADVLCLGGLNLRISWAGVDYPVRQVRMILRDVCSTPVVDGSTLRAVLEPLTLDALDDEGVISPAEARVLMMNALDRYGLARAIGERCREVIYGDLVFSFGIPVPVRSLSAMDSWARMLLPVVTRLPHQWAYATGVHSNRISSGHESYYDWADMIAGDFSYIRHYMPERLDGKVILTNTTTAGDIDLLSARGARCVVTTTPEIEGRAFAMNVTEGVFTALLGRCPDEITPDDYISVAHELGWQPQIRHLPQS